MNRNALLNKLLKIKELVDNGIGGERTVAVRKLELLMDKYGFTEDDLDISEMFWFTYNKKDKLSKSLLQQVIYSVLGDVELYRQNRKATQGCECSKSEAIEIEAKYNFYYESLQKDIELFYTAFLHKNYIFPPKSKVNIELRDEEIDVEEAERVYHMIRGIKKREFYQQLE